MNNKLMNLKSTFIFPNSGSMRFQVQLDKNGQVCEIRESFAQTIKDHDSKKKFVKITLGDRPRSLFERIKGRPFQLASPWILEYIEDTLNSQKEAELAEA